MSSLKDNLTIDFAVENFLSFRGKRSLIIMAIPLEFINSKVYEYKGISKSNL